MTILQFDSDRILISLLSVINRYAMLLLCLKTKKSGIMQVILGANGIIGEKLAEALKADFIENIRLVGRNPQKVNSTDELFKGDLLDPKSVEKAVEGAEIAYLTVGLPYNSEVWLRDWEIIMRNTISACIKNNCKLAYFDNTYAYPQDSLIQTEDTTLCSGGKKGRAKKVAAELLLDAISQQSIEAVICRAPEFYGPGKTKGVTNTLTFETLKAGKKPKIILNDNVLRTLIYTPDASRAMALIGNTDDAYGQTWHLPCDDNRLTYKQFIAEISNQLERPVPYGVLNRFILKLGSFFNANLKEIQELLPRYTIDNIFESTKFKNRFPDFQVTTYQQGIAEIIKDFDIK